jgi:ribosomal protein S7
VQRGNRYLRVLFVQAAWVTLVKVKPNRWERHGLKPWIEAARKRLHHNVLAIALANKLARPSGERPYRRAAKKRDERAPPCMSGKEHCEG